MYKNSKKDFSKRKQRRGKRKNTREIIQPWIKTRIQRSISGEERGIVRPLPEKHKETCKVF